MRGETEELVETVESAGRDRPEDVVVAKVNDLWNWQRDRMDVDVELRIGRGANLKAIIEAIEAEPEWTIRFLTTTDEEEMTVLLALVYHPPEPSPDGTIWLDELHKS